MRGPDRGGAPSREGYARLRRELADTDAAIRRILEAAPRATAKYEDVGRAGRAVRDALNRALADHAEANRAWLRYKRENIDGSS